MKIPSKSLISQMLVGAALISILSGLLVNASVFGEVTEKLFLCSVETFGQFWQWLVILLFATTILVAISPVGSKKLENEPPKLGFISWLAIILSTLLAGGGIFWSAAEPLFHLQKTPLSFEGMSIEPASAALSQSFFHWGFLAWTSLGTLALLPLYAARKDADLRNRPAALLFPIVSKRWLKSWIGSAVDVVSVVSALVGTIGPVGFLGLQLGYIMGKTTVLPDTYLTHILIIATLALVYTISAVRGIKKGIRILSLFNMGLCLVFGLTLLYSSSLSEMARITVDSATLYVQHFFNFAFTDTHASWTQNWTLFFWGWFLGYGPIMTIFVYKISKGRSIRQIFLAIAVLAPIATNIWFSVVGGSGILFDQAGDKAVTTALTNEGMPAALLAIIYSTETPILLLLLVIPLIFLFMATTGDSIAISVSSIFSSEEGQNKKSRIFWSVLMAAVAVTIIAVGQEGAIGIFQQTIVIASVPISVIMALASVSGLIVIYKIWSNSSE